MKEALREAMYYEKRDGGVVQCLLCPHHCVLSPGKAGICQVRRNVGGSLFSLNYGRVSSISMDPIEKKPLYHFYPGSQILSLGTLGCNLSCSFCQNASISQIPRNEVDVYFRRMSKGITPGQVAQMAVKEAAHGSVGVAYTYNEPGIWFEFVVESAREVRKIGQKNVLVTNGFLEIEPLGELLPLIDAFNVDLKGIRDSYYRKLCGGRVAPVLEYCRRAKEKALVEITNLVVTGENDREEDIFDLVAWVADNLGRDTPIHFSRYHPEYNFSSPATPVDTLVRAYEIATARLDYVYVGNVWQGDWDSTRCPSCHKVVVERSGYRIGRISLKEGSLCGHCGLRVAMVV